jgi:hypothetical protein
MEALTGVPYRKKKMRIKNVPISTVQAEMIAQFYGTTNNKYRDLSVLVRKENQSGVLITSAELYTLFWMASFRAALDPVGTSLQVSAATIASLQILRSNRYVC